VKILCTTNCIKSLRQTLGSIEMQVLRHRHSNNSRYKGEEQLKKHRETSRIPLLKLRNLSLLVDNVHYRFQ